MFDLEKHKQFLWKYTLSYGKLESDEQGRKIFPFFDIRMEADRSFSDYKTEETRQRLFSASSLKELYEMISPAYRGYYFMEISSLLHEDTALYSFLLKKTFAQIGTDGYISKKNYEHLVAFADEETRSAILEELKARQ